MCVNERSFGGQIAQPLSKMEVNSKLNIEGARPKRRRNVAAACEHSFGRVDIVSAIPAVTTQSCLSSTRGATYGTFTNLLGSLKERLCSVCFGSCPFGSC